MKIKFANPVTNDVTLERTLTKSQEHFWESDKKFIVLNGGFRCLEGKTKIRNADTGEDIAIEDLYKNKQEIRVFSWSKGKIVKAQALVPKKFNADGLFEVITENTRFTCTKKHRVLTPYGWKEVGSLNSGDTLLGVFPDFQETNSVSYLSILSSSVLNSLRKVQDCQSGCLSLFRSYDARLRSLKDTFQDVVPLQDDVHEHNPCDCKKDGFSEESRHIRFYQKFFHLSSQYSFHRLIRPAVIWAVQTLLKVSEYVFFLILFVPIFLLKIILTMQKALSVACNKSFSYLFFQIRPYHNPTLREDKLQEVRFVKNDVYYDIHVLGTNNYLAEGIFHHNSGKTEIMLLKTIYDCVYQPDNYVLMGRKTYQEIYDVLLKDFIDICPPYFIKSFIKSPHPTVVLNTIDPKRTSTIIFRNLDKLAETDIKGMTLGQIVIDQAEDIPENTFQALVMRLSRKGVKQRVYMNSNPALNWLFKKVRQENNTDWEVVSMPTTENYLNIPEETVKTYESFKESDPSYYRQYVLGVWDESLLSENTVFPREHIVKLEQGVKKPIRTFEGLLIFQEPIKGHRYQMGIDCSEGVEGGDNAAISVVDLTTLEEVASWAGKLKPEALAEQAVLWAGLYNQDYPGCMINPEMNSLGWALLNKLKELGYSRIYQREEFDKVIGKKIEKLGWRMTAQSKQLLISNFRHLTRHFNPIICTKESVEEFKTFVSTDEAKLKGAGAQIGFHDDRVIATLLAFWEKTRRDPKAEIIRNKEIRIPGLDIVPSIKVVNGVVSITNLPREEKSWMIG